MPLKSLKILLLDVKDSGQPITGQNILLGVVGVVGVVGLWETEGPATLVLICSDMVKGLRGLAKGEGTFAAVEVAGLSLS